MSDDSNRDKKGKLPVTSARIFEQKLAKQEKEPEKKKKQNN